jgi:hypothetical protein
MKSFVLMSAEHWKVASINFWKVGRLVPADASAVKLRWKIIRDKPPFEKCIVED